MGGPRRLVIAFLIVDDVMPPESSGTNINNLKPPRLHNSEFFTLNHENEIQKYHFINSEVHSNTCVSQFHT